MKIQELIQDFCTALFISRFQKVRLTIKLKHSAFYLSKFLILNSCFTHFKETSIKPNYLHTHTHVFSHSGHVESTYELSIMEFRHQAGFLIAPNQSEASGPELQVQSELALITTNIKGFRAAPFKRLVTAGPHPSPLHPITFNSSTAAITAARFTLEIKNGEFPASPKDPERAASKTSGTRCWDTKTRYRTLFKDSELGSPLLQTETKYYL